MCKLDLEKAEEPEIKLPQHPLHHRKSKRIPEILLLHLLLLQPLTVWITTNCGKFLERWEYQNTLPASWEICMQVRSNRTEQGTIDWFQIVKGVCQGCVMSPCLFSLYAEYIMRNAGLDEAQAGIKTARKISITSDKQMIPSLWQKTKN